MDYFHLSVGQDILHPMSSLALAHLGDGVYELMVRTWLCLKGKATNKGLHRAAVTYVSAPAQAKRVKLILPILTEEEQDVYRRARNSHTAAIPKDSSVNPSRLLARKQLPASPRYISTSSASNP